jgi:hypothetical protein
MLQVEKVQNKPDFGWKISSGKVSGMYGSILTLMLLTGANPGAGCYGGYGQDDAFSPYYCPHRQIDPTPGEEVYAQTSPHRPFPARTAGMWRYTYFYGINYARPNDYRLRYDYPWYKRGDALPHYSVEELIEAQEEWVPVEEMQPRESAVNPSPVTSAIKQPKRYRSALTVKRSAH